MMKSVVEKMKVHSSGTSSGSKESRGSMVSITNDPISWSFSSAFQEMMDKKVLTKKLRLELEMMFNMSGVTWICWSVIGEVLKLNRRDDLALAGK